MEPAMWATLQGSPRDVVTKLLGSKPIRAEGWKLVSGPSEDQSFVGYLTFEKAVAQKILGSSGRYGLFVEALARDQPVRAVVQWIAPGDMSGVAYLRDVLQQAKGRALAYRKGVLNEERPCRWLPRGGCAECPKKLRGSCGAPWIRTPASWRS